MHSLKIEELNHRRVQWQAIFFKVVVGPKDVASSTRQQHQGNDNVIDNRSDNNNDYATTAVKENIDNINCNVGGRQPSSADTEPSRGGMLLVLQSVA